MTSLPPTCRRVLLLLAASVSLCLPSNESMAAPADVAEKPTAVPAEFKDPVTGARIIHLSTLPNQASGVIYFTQECVTPDSRYALVRYLERSAGHTAGRMYRYDFTSGELVKLTDQITRNQAFAPKSGNLYYTDATERTIHATNIHDLKTRKVADLPPGITCSNLTVNTDETLLAGTGELSKEQAATPAPTTAPNQGPGFGNKYERHDTNLILTADIRTGKVIEHQRIDTWLGHTQFSPTDPGLLMFCHEGPWNKVDRIWTLRPGEDAHPTLILKRTEDNEIAGHEFWSTDGSTIWYDHNFRNTPGKQFLEGHNVRTKAITRYPASPEFASIHYVQSPDGRFFVCDGHAIKGHPERQGMFVLVPENGALRAVRLCSMERNDYAAAEPNPHLTPDQHWLLFTATFSGTPQAYALEMPREFWR